METSNLRRLDEITQACVKQILESWPTWNVNAEMSATIAQDSEAWYDEMHACLFQAIKAAVEEAAKG